MIQKNEGVINLKMLAKISNDYVKNYIEQKIKTKNFKIIFIIVN